MNKTLRVVIILAILIGAVLGGWRLIHRKSSDQKEQYKTEKIDRGKVTMTVTATGTLSAVTTVQVGSQVSGVISHLYADFNSHVQKGQVLAELDPTPFQAQAEQRQADVTKATVDMRNAKLNYDRQQRLVNGGLAAQADLDNARANYEAAQAQVAQASAALRQSQTNLHYTRILSPIDGVVADRQYDVGQTVAASFQAPTLFTIAQDLTKMQVLADVDQSDIGRVHAGQTARFTVDAYPDEDFVGKISQLRLNATVNQNVVSYPVIIEVPNPGERLRPKMTANVTIEVASVDDVLRVPNAALRFKPVETNRKGDTAANGSRSRNGQGQGGGQGQSFERNAGQMGERGGGLAGAGRGFGRSGKREHAGQTIHLLVDGKLKPVEIIPGISDGRFTEIKSGSVKEGDDVVIGMQTAKVDDQSQGRPGGAGGGPRMGRF